MQVVANLWRETPDFLLSRHSVCIKVTYIHCVFFLSMEESSHFI